MLERHVKNIYRSCEKFSIQGIRFRGHIYGLGSTHTGEFEMAVELIAEFDPFLAKHIEIYGNEGKGNTSYLSYQTCKEFISIMAEKEVKYIVDEVKEGKYFSTILDSTPDIINVDQLYFVVRYLSKCGFPVERFICFLSNPGHKSEELATALLGLLNK
jgi:hypothetical protein